MKISLSAICAFALLATANAQDQQQPAAPAQPTSAASPAAPVQLTTIVTSIIQTIIGPAPAAPSQQPAAPSQQPAAPSQQPQAPAQGNSTSSTDPNAYLSSVLSSIIQATPGLTQANPSQAPAQTQSEQQQQPAQTQQQQQPAPTQQQQQPQSSEGGGLLPGLTSILTGIVGAEALPPPMTFRTTIKRPGLIASAVA